MTKKPTLANTLPLGELFDLFVKATPEGHLEDSTLLTMRIHLGHAAEIRELSVQLSHLMGPA